MSHNTSLQFGEYLPLSLAGTPTLGISDFDPRDSFPYERGAVGVFPWGTTLLATDAENSTLAMTASGEWQPGDRSNLRLDVQRSISRASSFTASSSVFMSASYLPREVVALGGEVRQALTFDGTANLNQMYALSDGETATTDTISLRGSVTPGKWSFDYGAGFAHGAQNTPRLRSLVSRYLDAGHRNSVIGSVVTLLQPDRELGPIAADGYAQFVMRATGAPLDSTALWSAQTFIERANVDARAGRHKDALRWLSEAVARGPSNYSFTNVVEASDTLPLTRTRECSESPRIRIASFQIPHGCAAPRRLCASTCRRPSTGAVAHWK